MIGRGSYGRPWIFEEIKYYKENNLGSFKLETSEKKKLIILMKILKKFLKKLQIKRIIKFPR